MPGEVEIWVLVKARSMFLETGPIFPSAVVGVLGHTPLFPETGRKTNGACAFSCFWSLARGSRLGCPLEQQLDAPGTPWGQSTC